MDIVLAFWRIQTLPCFLDDYTTARKVTTYINKARNVADTMDAERKRLGIPLAKMMFLAPEHLFRCSSTRMANSAADSEAIVHAVRQFSASYPDLMVVPGTIVWLEEKKLAGHFGRKHLARNSAFVFCNGQLVFRYDKHHDAGELLDVEKQNAKFLPGQLLGSFNLWGLNFGIEICKDHAEQHLVKQATDHGVGKFDIHMIISSTIHNIGNSLHVKDGGLIIHSDGRDDRTSGVAQPTTSKRTGVWEVQPRLAPKTGGKASAGDKLANPGQYLDLNRRNSLTLRCGAAAVGMQFQGFDNDVSVYHMTV